MVSASCFALEFHSYYTAALACVKPHHYHSIWHHCILTAFSCPGSTLKTNQTKIPFMAGIEINNIYVWNSHRLHFQGFLSQNLQLILERTEQWKRDHKNQKSSKLKSNLLHPNKGIKTAASDTAYVKLPISLSQEANWNLDDMNLLARRTHVEWMDERYRKWKKGSTQEKREMTAENICMQWKENSLKANASLNKKKKQTQTNWCGAKSTL